MTKDEALKTALEALERINDRFDLESVAQDATKAITALEKALAQPEQEPFEYWNAVEGWVKIDEVREHFDAVGCGTIYKTAGEDRVPVYTTPPPHRTWVGLEAEEVQELRYKIDVTAHWTYDDFAQAIEAKLKEKNT